MAHKKKELQQTKPLILAIENSTLCGSVALVSGDLCLCEFSLLSRMTHSKRLLGSIDYIMQNCEISWDDIDGIAISLGPGSFTGLRIGLATAKGLAMATDLPLMGVSSLDGLAAQLPHAGHLICSVLDARKKEVYAAFYRVKGEKTKRISDYLAVTPQKLTEQITEPVILLGDGAELYADFFREKLGEHVLFAPSQLILPKASAIGFLAINKWQSNNFLDTALVGPIYVRPSDAEIHFKGN
ncbi:MAG: tRNA (adenosine(37)-N6)-threonylcarbamoyltransferase complex dimerization subunit type 1 TsaB [Desulfobulbaceae bacterium]|nr:tRNA (adenosine(37)-N6)-threonylcarbamoyltransferase complex dimerization subunit type 1 TsaB [Desulfobulbaceae bacterium]